jgi:hypothetical protein
MRDLIDALWDKQKVSASPDPIMLGTPESAEATEQSGKFLLARVR